MSRYRLTTKGAAPLNGNHLSAAGKSPARSRLDNIDFVRGLVMVIMVLDHCRGFLSNARFNPMDLAVTTPAFYFTRWITHYCAPTFVFLAGCGAFFYGARGRTKAELSWFLLSRGLWLVLLELTLIRWGMQLNWNYQHTLCQVIWAIGWSMAALSALVYLPTWIVGAIGLIIVAGHNLLDSIHAAHFGAWGWLWILLHEPATVKLRFPESLLSYQPSFFLLYSLLPWFGVLAAGYGFGAICQLPAARRRRTLICLGLVVTALFVVLRLFVTYGDPKPRLTEFRVTVNPAVSTPVLTILSFLNCEKYPPSLCFLLMTIGPAILLVGIVDRPIGPWGQWLVTFGRVPLFFYLGHWPIINFLSVFVRQFPAWLPSILATSLGIAPSQFASGLPLAGVYLLWLLCVSILYLPCRWFAKLKSRRKDIWLSYL